MLNTDSMRLRRAINSLYRFVQCRAKLTSLWYAFFGLAE
jgi:hypothetical protein